MTHMADHGITPLSERRLGERGLRTQRTAMSLGVLALAATAVITVATGLRTTAMFAYLLNLGLFLSISLGALFFVLLQHVTRAGWSVTVRRLAELIAAPLPWLAVLTIPVIALMPDLYGWSHATEGGHGLADAKAFYLSPGFFTIRLVAYFLIWIGLSRYFRRRSVEQDEAGIAALSLKMQSRSAPALVLYAFSATFASMDLFMSLDSHWFSSIYGVHFFAGCVVGFTAFVILCATLLQRCGMLTRDITVEHYHDLGKLLFAFVFFWGYIAFSQYMLIWYGNLPEETSWYLRRQEGIWVYVSLALLVGHFLLPFPGLLSRSVKRYRPVLIAWAVWMLVMHWLDLFWLIMPERVLRPEETGSIGTVVALNLSSLIGVGGIYLGVMLRTMRKHDLLAVNDPRLPEAMAFANH